MQRATHTAQWGRGGHQICLLNQLGMCLEQQTRLLQAGMHYPAQAYISCQPSALNPAGKQESGEGTVSVTFCMTYFHCLVQFSMEA